MSMSGATHDLLATAADLVTTSQLGSASMLQRKLRINFGLAVRLLNDLEQLGIVGPPAGTAPGEVLHNRQTAMALLARRATR